MPNSSASAYIRAGPTVHSVEQLAQQEQASIAPGNHVWLHGMLRSSPRRLDQMTSSTTGGGVMV